MFFAQKGTKSQYLRKTGLPFLASVFFLTLLDFAHKAVFPHRWREWAFGPLKKDPFFREPASPAAKGGKEGPNRLFGKNEGAGWGGTWGKKKTALGPTFLIFYRQFFEKRSKTGLFFLLASDLLPLLDFTEDQLLQ